VHLPDGSTLAVRHNADLPRVRAVPAPDPGLGAEFTGATEDVALGRLCGARSGDKGGDANVGLWAVSPRAYAWLRRYLTTDRFRELLTEAAGLEIDRYELPNLLALNFVVHGLIAPACPPPPVPTSRPRASASTCAPGSSRSPQP
jgi:hypothetical protein